ncbi:MAG TPA: single-stranded DNA-binding protein [Lentimicrobium sp.]|nr:single-stranded DNA-binding protein [Lentimicrobium sp.]
MNSLRNRVTLIGRLGAEPVVRTIDGNRKVVRMTLATSDQFMKNGEKTKETQWHSLVVWGPLCDTCEKYLTKGKEIAVEGKIVYRKWDDKEGNNHFMTEINVDNLLMIGGNKEN